jgi:hypothetical protein
MLTLFYAFQSIFNLFFNLLFNPFFNPVKVQNLCVPGNQGVNGEGARRRKNKRKGSDAPTDLEKTP